MHQRMKNYLVIWSNLKLILRLFKLNKLNINNIFFLKRLEECRILRGQNNETERKLEI